MPTQSPKVQPAPARTGVQVPDLQQQGNPTPGYSDAITRGPGQLAWDPSTPQPAQNPQTGNQSGSVTVPDPYDTVRKP